MCNIIQEISGTLLIFLLLSPLRCSCVSPQPATWRPHGATSPSWHSASAQSLSLPVPSSRLALSNTWVPVSQWILTLVNRGKKQIVFFSKTLWYFISPLHCIFFLHIALKTLSDFEFHKIHHYRPLENPISRFLCQWSWCLLNLDIKAVWWVKFMFK